MNPSFIVNSGLISDDGRDLTLEANLHLFQWPGRLVQGADIPYATDTQDTEEQKDITDWNYLALDAKQAPYLNQNQDSVPLPDLSIEEMRSQLGLDKPSSRINEYPEHSPYRPGFAREGQAQAFDARQNRNLTISEDREIPNPVLTELGIEILGTMQGDRFQDTLGAWWVLSTLSDELLGFELLRLERVRQFGSVGAARVLKIYLEALRQPAEIQSEVEWLKTHDFDLVERNAKLKLRQIESEINKWAEIGHRPICLADGTVDKVLTIAQAVTALTGIYQLTVLALKIQDFVESGRSALGEIG